MFVWGWDAWATVQLTALRRSLLDRIGDPELASRPPVAMVVAAENATHFTSAVSETFATGAVETHRFRVGLPLEELVAGLNAVRGDTLAAYPSMLARLLGEAQAGRLDIEPRRIVTMAEPLLPQIRAGAEELWRAPVANMWGTSEAGVTAIGCFKGEGCISRTTCLIVEAVDESGKPVPAGERSHKVYVTNLFNPVMPLIRYEITDEVTLMDEPCACGSAHRRIADIQGRSDDTFEYANGTRIHPHVFRSILGRDAAIVEYQARQTPAGADITICTQGAVDPTVSPASSRMLLLAPAARSLTVTVSTAEQHPEVGDRQAQALRAALDGPPRT